MSNSSSHIEEAMSEPVPGSPHTEENDGENEKEKEEETERLNPMETFLLVVSICVSGGQ